MDSIKNRERNRRIKLKLFSCSQPVATDDASPIKPNRTCIAVRGKDCMVIPKILTSLSEDKSKVSAGDVVAGSLRPKEKSRRSISRILKAVLFEAKKIRKRKARQSSLPEISTKNNTFVSSVNEINLNRESSETGDNFRINSRTSFCRSCTSSINSSNSRSVSETKASFRANSIGSKQVYEQTSMKKVGGYYDSDIRLCLLLICLSVLIFCGKFCAIFCTATWFFFAPGRNNRVGSPEIGLTGRR